ncbi:MucR family transcriptional regulator [Methylobacterium nigriterrae]|uniref:MucR family transcriptional regulator n=1 Tax=Methylobacterium nigriterrae TaxID=3127512 RepID=UPI0030139DC3
MPGEAQEHNTNFIEVAGDIVSAYVSKNSVPATELPALIARVHAALVGLSQPQLQTEEKAEKPTPSQIKRSITPDGLTSFIDGKPYKTLKRHLGSHGLDPHTYRQRFGLPADYPMVAAGYAAQRSELAKAIGLGRGGMIAAETAEKEAESASKAPSLAAGERAPDAIQRAGAPSQDETGSMT